MSTASKKRSNPSLRIRGHGGDGLEVSFQESFRLHYQPDSIISNTDLRFKSRFWQQLMNMWCVHLKISTSKHPQHNGGIKITNRIDANFLHCYCNYHRTNWAHILPAAEYAYNSETIDSIRKSTFEDDLGRQPALVIDVLGKIAEPTIPCVTYFKTRLMRSFDDANFSLRFAQVRRSAYNQICYTPLHCTVGDEVILCCKLFTTATSISQPSKKIEVKRYGLWLVLELICDNCIHVQLPINITKHTVIHVDHNAWVCRQPTDISNSQPASSQSFIDETGYLVIEVESILAHRGRGRNLCFPTIYKEAQQLKAEWKPLKDLADADNTIIAALNF